MKLAEALILKADMKAKLERLRVRIAASAMVQEKSKPQENAESLLKEATGVLGELAELTERINRTNAKAKMVDGRTVLEAIAERERLKQHHALLSFASEAARKEPERYSMAEIKWVPQLDVAKLNKHVEDVSKKIREINTRMQEANWKIELED